MSTDIKVAVVSVVIILAGVVGGFYAYQSATSAQEQINESVNTTGEITNTSIEREEIQRYDQQRERTVEEIQYVVNLEYEYEVDGQNYTSTQITPTADSQAFGTRSAARSFRNNYSVGETVTVRYVPSNPQQSYIIEAEPSPLGVVVVFTIITLVGILLLLRSVGIIPKFGNE